MMRCRRSDSDRAAGTWRCEVCGSRAIARRVWLDSNTNRLRSDAEERSDLWCDDCQEHTRQIRECDLLRRSVEPWWSYDTTIEDRQVVTVLIPEGFSPEDGARAFLDACAAVWNGKSGAEKIEIWRYLTRPEE